MDKKDVKEKKLESRETKRSLQNNELQHKQEEDRKDKASHRKTSKESLSNLKKEGSDSRALQKDTKPETRNHQKTDVSKNVVQWLNPYYKRKIATKELFKALAKLLTQRICDGSLGKIFILPVC